MAFQLPLFPFFPWSILNNVARAILVNIIPLLRIFPWLPNKKLVLPCVHPAHAQPLLMLLWCHPPGLPWLSLPSLWLSWLSPLLVMLFLSDHPHGSSLPLQVFSNAVLLNEWINANVTITAFSFNSHSSIVEAQRLISLEHFLSRYLDSGSQEGVYYTFQPSTCLHVWMCVHRSKTEVPQDLS